MATVIEITSADHLNTVLRQNHYVVVDFWAEWCPPCKMISPMYAEYAAKYSVPGQLVLAKVNIDQLKEVAAKYQVTALPTLMFFTGGEPKPVKAPAAKGACVVAGDVPETVRRLVGADPRAMNAVIQVLNKEAIKKRDEKRDEKPKKQAVEEDTPPISGGYTLGSTGHRADWKMSLH